MGAFWNPNGGFIVGGKRLSKKEVSALKRNWSKKSELPFGPLKRWWGNIKFVVLALFGGTESLTVGNPAYQSFSVGIFRYHFNPGSILPTYAVMFAPVTSPDAFPEEISCNRCQGQQWFMHAIGVTPAGRSPAMDLSLIIIAHARQTIPWDLLMLATLDADGAGYSTFALAESPAEYTVQRPQRRFLRLCGERDAENPMGLYGG